MVQGFVERFGYVAILALLGGAGVGLPFPEELTQLTAGFLAHAEYLRLPLAVAACWLGIVGGDFVWFELARRHGERVLEAKPVRKVLTPERRAMLEAHFARHAFWTVVVARHTSGLRLPAFALAALHGVKARTFVLADGLSALVSVPLVVGAGYLFSHHLTEVHADIRRIELGILAVVVLAAAVLVLVRRRRGARASLSPAQRGSGSR